MAFGAVSQQVISDVVRDAVTRCQHACRTSAAAIQMMTEIVWLRAGAVTMSSASPLRENRTVLYNQSPP
jgi:hypothetical protein